MAVPGSDAEPVRHAANSGDAGAIKTSPFFHVAPTAENGSLAILHLKRDSLMAITLNSKTDDGYGTECAVTNTRFGSFPHNTLIGLGWGSQVRASKVDTGSRGRRGKMENVKDIAVGADGQAAENEEVQEKVSKKRGAGDADLDEDDGVAKKARHEATVPQLKTTASKKRNSDGLGANGPSKKHDYHQAGSLSDQNDLAPPVRAPVDAGSGFVHLLPPTPEAWTSSLDHRTQVVYTPDYSYILQRLRAKPGSILIEAGAGSGSFTHAAARAVFSGYSDPAGAPAHKKRKIGKVYSYEYHEPRVQTLRQELTEHGLDDVVHLTHRDVCNDGFVNLDPDTASPLADAIFLDLPAPWKALKHLTHESPSPLNPDSAVHLCTFSPCIEQVTATVSHLRRSGWTEIEMIEVQNRRIDVRREQIGLKNEGLRGVNASAATVDEAIGRLREVEGKMGEFHATKGGTEGTRVNGSGTVEHGTANGKDTKGPRKRVQTKAERLENIKRQAEERKLYKEGNLVHRTESEVKTHTSYLIYAVLPRQWTEEDERAFKETWSVDEIMKVEKADGEVGDSG